VYRRVLSVCSIDADEGERFAICMVRNIINVIYL
jgi:hypothetical protein